MEAQHAARPAERGGDAVATPKPARAKEDSFWRGEKIKKEECANSGAADREKGLAITAGRAPPFVS